MLRNLDAYADWFQYDAANCVITLVMTILVLLISLILHECAHGWMALRCGDPTAKMIGRLSLNPLRHLDLFGTLCMLLAGFGWAKPVPVNPRNFENYRRDDFLVSIAGIVTNLTLFIICSLLAVMLNAALWKQNMVVMGMDVDFHALLERAYGGVLTSEDMVNVFYNGTNLSTYIAYGTSFDWMTPSCNAPWLLYVQRFLLMMANTNLCLAIFNFLPIPPLDGFHILNDTLLRGKLRMNQQMFQAAQLMMLILMFSTDIVSNILSAGTDLIGGSVIRMFLMLTGQM